MLGKRNNPFGDKNKPFEKRKQIPFFEKKKNLSEKKKLRKRTQNSFFLRKKTNPRQIPLKKEEKLFSPKKETEPVKKKNIL